MINEAISSILQQEAEAVRNIPITDGYEEAVTLIVKHVHELGGNLITSGMGKAGQIAMNIATTFCSTGTPAYFLHPSEAQHGDLGIVRKNDVMLLISNSGKTRELLELVELTRGLVPEMQFIVITKGAERVAEVAARFNLDAMPGKQMAIDADRCAERSVSFRPHPHHIDHGHDGDRRPVGSRHHETHQLRLSRLCQTASRRLPGFEKPRTV